MNEDTPLKISHDVAQGLQRKFEGESTIPILRFDVPTS
jgi:hypothetical protein